MIKNGKIIKQVQCLSRHFQKEERTKKSMFPNRFGISSGGKMHKMQKKEEVQFG